MGCNTWASITYRTFLTLRKKLLQHGEWARSFVMLPNSTDSTIAVVQSHWPDIATHTSGFRYSCTLSLFVGTLLTTFTCPTSLSLQLSLKLCYSLSTPPALCTLSCSYSVSLLLPPLSLLFSFSLLLVLIQRSQFVPHWRLILTSSVQGSCFTTAGHPHTNSYPVAGGCHAQGYREWLIAF